jgi:hypothetical protein
MEIGDTRIKKVRHYTGISLRPPVVRAKRKPEVTPATPITSAKSARQRRTG